MKKTMCLSKTELRHQHQNEKFKTNFFITLIQDLKAVIASLKG